MEWGALVKVCPLALVLAIVTGLAGCGASSPGGGRVKNFEAEGNLQSLNDIGCARPEGLRNTYTPADLYRGTAECVRSADYESAVYSSALAGLYARYDRFRVVDDTAGQAEAAVLVEYMGSLTDEQQTTFFDNLRAVADDPEKLAALCGFIRKLGPPAYYPTYMIQHSMAAVLGRDPREGLVSNFDDAAVWETALDGYLHCSAPTAK